MPIIPSQENYVGACTPRNHRLHTVWTKGPPRREAGSKESYYRDREVVRGWGGENFSHFARKGFQIAFT